MVANDKMKMLTDKQSFCCVEAQQLLLKFTSPASVRVWFSAHSLRRGSYTWWRQRSMRAITWVPRHPPRAFSSVSTRRSVTSFEYVWKEFVFCGMNGVFVRGGGCFALEAQGIILNFVTICSLYGKCFLAKGVILVPWECFHPIG